MSIHCEVCGRSIKSGRKYCWEHRYTAQAQELSLLKKIERAYLKRRAVYYIIPLLLILIGINYLSLSYYDANRGEISDSFPLSIFFITMVSLPIVLWIIKYKIKREIRSNREKFVKFAEGYARNLKKEREFRKSIFR